MSPERRYDEQEIAAIFKQAAADQEAAQRQLAPSGGLTLAELEQIGKEAGITPEYIARAAASLDRAARSPRPVKLLGLPLSVGRIVDLPGPLSDEAWDRLVTDLRETFQAAGVVRRDGSHRQWRNGNLHAIVEPTDSGHRLHLRTLNGNQRAALTGGFAFFAINLAILLVFAASHGVNPESWLLALFSAIGLGSMGMAAYRLPRWSAERERQMDAIAARAVELAGGSAAAGLPEPAPARRLDLAASEEPEEPVPAKTRRRART